MCQWMQHGFEVTDPFREVQHTYRRYLIQPHLAQPFPLVGYPCVNDERCSSSYDGLHRPTCSGNYARGTTLQPSSLH
jgi:hypothetical protein